jgi:hypothetical protein
MQYKIDYWRLTFLIALPIGLVLLFWLLCTLPLQDPKLFTRLVTANIIIWHWLLLHASKALIKKESSKELGSNKNNITILIKNNTKTLRLQEGSYNESQYTRN